MILSLGVDAVNVVVVVAVVPCLWSQMAQNQEGLK